MGGMTPCGEGPHFLPAKSSMEGSWGNGTILDGDHEFMTQSFLISTLDVLLLTKIMPSTLQPPFEGWGEVVKD